MMKRSDGDAIRLVELGPGNGTLSGDILRKFKDAGQMSRISSMELVEISECLRPLQEASLSRFDIEKKWHESVYSVGKSMFHPL